ncbi:MAG TPA: ATP-binding protein, partial [Vicinamibacteria bacterium]|nr:ATP-binding protein [Vicinamibacteria bacterium]
LSDAANRASSPDEVFAAALDAIRDVLGAQRASVLTFDAGGVMRFRAWRGLSDEYRAAVEGHSPWPPGARDPRPIVVPDVGSDPDLAAFGALFAREGIRSLAFIPLLYGDRLLGKFMLYSAVPRRLEPRELEQAGAIAAQVASAVGRAHSQEALQEASRRKDEFLAMLSHELRNPLAAARNAVHLLSTVPADEETRRRWTEVIGRQTGNLVRIVDDLLDVSRITRGRIELRHEPTDLRVVVQRALAATADLLSAHRLQAALPAATLPVKGDPVRLEQVFVNLLANAAKYTPAGGRVEVAAERQGSSVVVRVGDSGMGIESDRLLRVFDLFDQGGRDLARTQGGLGVGLTIVRALVELHGGRVEACSAGPGQGSQFVVHLPAHEGGAAADVAVAAVAAAGDTARRVLVVDDHVDSCEMLAALLQAWGHSVDVVTEAAAVVERVRAGSPDLVLLDIGLPGTNGYELARILTADPHTRAAILVALTGYGQPSDRERALASGFAHHLVKPVQPDALRALLESLATRPAAT